MKKNSIFIKLKSINSRILSIYTLFLIKILNKLNLYFTLINLPKKNKKITLLKAAHVYKKAREQFELMTYQKIIQIESFFF